MNFLEIFIKRPILAIVVNILIISAGTISYLKLSVRGTPDIDPPIITIETVLAGADASFMEKSVTKVIEKSLSNVKDVENISSSSSSSVSEIVVTFKIEADINLALNDVRSKVSEVSYKLPPNIESPVISKMDRNSWPSIWVCATGENYDPIILTDIITQRVKSRLEKLNSVSHAKLFSNYSYAIQINPDPVKLFYNKISPIELSSKITNQTQDYPAGNLKNDYINFVLNLRGSMDNVKQFEQIIVKNQKDKVIKLRDIADISIKPLDNDSVIRYMGTETVTIGIIRTSKSNVIEMSDEVLRELDSIKRTLPEDIELHIAYDSSVPLKASIKSVYRTALEALVLVAFIIYLFLGNPRIVAIPLVTIPISIIGTFAFMHAMNFSINLYSLLAMIMAIGLVVDDAIVVLENIYRYKEQSMSAYDASVKGIKEISFAIVAMTLTLAAVFLPIGFVDGFVGKLFIEFAWTLAFCVIISGVAALTLAPTISRKMLEYEDYHSKPEFIENFEKKLAILTSYYKNKLNWALSHPKQIGLITFASICFLAFASFMVKKEFIPTEDDGIIVLGGTGPDGASAKRILEATQNIERILSSVPEIKGYFINIYGNKLYGFVPLVDWSERSKSQQKVISLLNPQLMHIPAITTFASNPSFMGGMNEKPVTFVIQGYGTFNELDSVSQKFLSEMQKSPLFYNVDRDIRTSIPTVELQVNRDLAAIYKVPFEDIGASMQYLFGMKRVSEITLGNEKYNVYLGLKKDDRSNISDLSKIYIRSSDGKMINFANLATITETISVNSYNHFDTTKAVTITADLNEKYSMKDAESEIKKLADNYLDKSSYSIKYLGDIKRMQETNSSVIFTFVIALLFIYLLLSAQFNSFYDPLFIMLAVPFSITGGLLALYIFGSSINLYSNIGVVTLIGLITKNSIMIIEFANQIMTKIQDKRRAIIEASTIRLRPILMTTLATIFGALPLVFASGPSAAARSSIGLVIVGGMFIGTIFTLFVIPSIYFRFKK